MGDGDPGPYRDVEEDEKVGAHHRDEAGPLHSPEHFVDMDSLRG